MMQKVGRYRFFMGIIFCSLIMGEFSAPGVTWGGLPDVQVIEQGIDALVHLHAEMAERINIAHSIRTDLMAKDREFTHEINTSRQKLKDTTYSDAMADHRIRHNLLLIQLITGYCSALDEKIGTYHDGLVKLKYLINRAGDELKMVKALEDYDTAELLADIDQVITEYQVEINSDLIESDKIATRSCERIWEDIVEGKL